MAETEKLTFPILVDEDLVVTKSYGILNEGNPSVPHPTVVIVDKAGTVRFVHLDEDYRRRPAPEEVLSALKEAVESEAPPSEAAAP